MIKMIQGNFGRERTHHKVQQSKIFFPRENSWYTLGDKRPSELRASQFFPAIVSFTAQE